MGGFEVSRPVARRMRIAAELPTEYPVVLDEVQTLLGSLPDPDTLCAEQRAGTMTQLARLRNQIDACLSEVAETADREGDSRVLHAGTSGMLVAVVLNAFATGALSVPVDRYQARIIWLVPLAAALGLAPRFGVGLTDSERVRARMTAWQNSSSSSPSS